MSMFENDQFRWRETYFVFFDAAKRPSLDRVERKLAHLGDRYVLQNPRADTAGGFESITLLSPDDFAAMDICYVGGEEVIEQAGQLAEEMRQTVYDPAEQAKIKRMRTCDGRFDVLHFEQVAQGAEEEEDEEMLDPGAVLLVLDLLVKLTGGIAVDPQSGTLV